MTGKRYYLATLGAWRRHAPRLVNSHFVILGAHPNPGTDQASAGNCVAFRDPNDAVPILALVEADEGAHLALEDDAEVEALPHPLAQKPVSDAVRSALAAHGVPPGATTFDAAEILARVHPLLRHRVF